MKLVMRVLLVLAFLVVLTRGALASDDWFTTDFQFDLQPPPGVFVMWDGTLGMATSNTTGRSLLNRVGVDVCPVRGVDLFALGHWLDFDMKRTNRYTFDVSGRTLGLRLQVLPENRNFVGITAGVMQEDNSLGRVYRNGVDIGLSAPSEASFYGFLLAGRQVSKRLRVQLGLQSGNVSVGPIKATQWEWSLGSEYWFDKRLSLAGNVKQITVTGLPTNDNLSLRLNYRPSPSTQFQFRTDYFTKGATGQMLVSDPLAQTLGTRFQGTPTLSFSLQAGVRFGFGRTVDARPSDGGCEMKPAKPASKTDGGAQTGVKSGSDSKGGGPKPPKSVNGVEGGEQKAPKAGGESDGSIQKTPSAGDGTERSDKSP